MLKSQVHGALAGLQLMVDVQQPEYTAVVSHGAGVRMLLHNRGEFPDVENLGIRISAGDVASVALQHSWVISYASIEIIRKISCEDIFFFRDQTDQVQYILFPFPRYMCFLRPTVIVLTETTPTSKSTA